MNGAGDQVLLCRVEGLLCALPIDHVVETMRPLPVQPLAGTPRFVRGVSLIRGAPLPVVDAAALLGTAEAPPARFVILRADDRRFALAVGTVLGVRAIPRESFHQLEPLIRDAGSETIDAIGSLEAGLLLVLRSGRIVPDSVWSALESLPGIP
jgi:purine-binding chemotaxis protein CheW